MVARSLVGVVDVLVMCSLIMMRSAMNLRNCDWEWHVLQARTRNNEFSWKGGETRPPNDTKASRNQVTWGHLLVVDSEPNLVAQWSGTNVRYVQSLVCGISANINVNF